MKSLARNGIGCAALVVMGGLLVACGDLDGGPLLRPGEATGTIRFMNETKYFLNAATISDCNNSTYGFNRFENGDGIPSGQYRDFTVSAGCWDVAAGAVGVGHEKQRLQVAAGGVSQYTLN